MLGIPAPKITREDAIKIAKAEFDRRGLTYSNVVAREKLRVFSVWMRYGYLPCPVVVIDNQDGKVLQVLLPPR